MTGAGSPRGRNCTAPAACLNYMSGNSAQAQYIRMYGLCNPPRKLQEGSAGLAPLRGVTLSGSPAGDELIPARMRVVQVEERHPALLQDRLEGEEPDVDDEQRKQTVARSAGCWR